MPDQLRTFFQPHLSGGRFERGGVPTDTLEDLRVYHALITALARHIFLTEHPERHRVPSGFSERFELVLAGVERGSTVPCMQRVQPDGWTPEDADEFDRAQDLLFAVIEAANNDDLPQRMLPASARGHLERFGRSLRDGEQMTMRRTPEHQGPLFTREIRQRILRRPGAHYEDEITCSGPVRTTNTINRTFTIDDHARGQITGTFTHEHEDDLLAASRLYRVISARLVGTARFAPDGRPAKITSISAIELEDIGPDTSQRLNELRELEDGWYGPGSKAPDAALLDRVGVLLLDAIEQNMPRPLLFPTPEGGVQAEWQHNSLHAEAEFPPTGAIELLAYDEADPDATAENTLPLHPTAAESLARFVKDSLFTARET